LKVGDELLGILDIFTKTRRQFKPWEKEILKYFAHYAATSFQKIALRFEAEKSLKDREKLQKLTEIMLKMTQASAEEELLELLLNGAVDLVGSAKVGISKLDYQTGELKTVAKTHEPDQETKVEMGKGITGSAFSQEKTINVHDVSDPKWKGIYIKYWNDTKSEIAIPILVERVPVRIKTDVRSDGTKNIGVLNLESPEINAFSNEDQERLELIARYTAIRIAKIETDQRLNDLKPIEQALVNERNFDSIINAVIDGITNVLKFEFVNISLVNPERTRIKTEYVSGLSKELSEEFKKLANHDLNPSHSRIDIQADLVRKREIEVPIPEDLRLDQNIFKKFHHKNLLRVFLPMIEPARGMVIGTVEAAYDRRYRKYIYEQDVQILKNFVDYALHALEQRKSGFIDRITHEFRSPIVGIRSNADFLKRRFEELDDDFRNKKFSDVLTDCEILLYQVGELEYILGDRNSQKLKIRRTCVFRDIIIKTVNQLKPIVQEQSFKISNIIYNPDDSKKILVDTDPFKLNQVVYNLLINSIKYADKDPAKFKIEIELMEDKNYFTIKFKDWGIGIDKKHNYDIFREGFRCPEAWRMDVNGTGLGLTISKIIMLQLDGDLILQNNKNPTEFHLKLPKQIKQKKLKENFK
jgi:putative methionine-R-sulfoxide reductase with GAF domain/nitrogen-specific signal transduction histidine kinase